MREKTKDEARSWLWIGIMCVTVAIVVVGLLYLIPPEEMSGEPIGYTLAVFFFIFGLLCIVFRKRIAQWGTAEKRFEEKPIKEKPKKTRNIKAVTGTILAVGLLSLAAAFVIISNFRPMTGVLEILLSILLFLLLGIGAISTAVGIALFIGLYLQAWKNRTISTSHAPLSLLKFGLFVLGIGAVIFTIGTCIASYPLGEAAGARELVKEGGVSPNC